MTILLFNEITVKGIYTYAFFGLIFLVGCVLYFVKTENSKKKIIWVIILIPTIIFVLLFVYFSQIKYKTELNDKYDIEVYTGGFMGCGEQICITETFLGIFNKKVKHINGLCVIGINKILVEKNNDTKFKLLIFHNKVMDSESSIKYELELENKD